ncbi:hypothetical protein EG68_03752 [Paragonimus skrjabini miyazakii]|uniref:Deoxyribonuclease n=1 Tax=Paragonimus skrjabini miyazakii TaxID=59628 RepID=A0A8S9Z0L8_9TREM|nr:hypothetical protein EG68_03752 [Paragonimus skrjabini miyazakii]
MHCFVYALLIVSLVQTECSLRLGSFNVQILGVKKISKPTVFQTLLKILLRYDLIVIQEVRDLRGFAFQKLLAELNKQTDGAYGGILSKRLGRTSSKEQYAVFYKPTKLTINDMGIFADPSDRYERPPMHFIVKPKSKVIPVFGMVTVHLDPDDVIQEMKTLYRTVENYRRCKRLQNVLIVGDMNLDCSYAPARERSTLSFHTNPSYFWLISDRHDTTVSKNVCAYDRMIAYGSRLLKAIGNKKAEVYRFDEDLHLTNKQAKLISDHYPIEVTFE